MNKFLKILAVIGVGAMMSGFFFGVSFTFIPESINTKMMLGVAGMILWGIDVAKKQSSPVPRSLVVTVILAAIFSILCYNAALINKTNDYTYADYIVSFFVWLFAAYTVCYCIKGVHGRVSIRLVTAYLAAVCVFQCVTAIWIDNSQAFSDFVDRYFSFSQDFVRERDRLYGIGAFLDPAGCRFTIVELLIAHILATDWEVRSSKSLVALYFISFIIIIVVGDMISRTTIVGAALGIAYFAVARISDRRIYGNDYSNLYWIALLLIVVAVIIVTSLYNSSPTFHKSMRFAFEGFFNWYETGVWSTSSTDKLNATMWIWPETTRDWIWGTGVFGHYDYSTDIGYCRFILYCGLVGFVAFSAFFVQNAISLVERQPELRLLAVFLLALTFVIWVKVATDIFLIYALLYHLDSPEDLEAWEEAQERGDDEDEELEESPEF